MSTAIRNCTFAFRCDQQWQKLKNTQNSDVRFCGECQREVFFCHTDKELAEAITLNRCVAINVGDEERSQPIVTMGLPELPR